MSQVAVTLQRRAGAAGGPSEPPAPAGAGPVAAAVALSRLPADLVVAVGYLVRELPSLVQDLRSVVHSLALLAQAGHSGALADLLADLSRAAGKDGELTLLLAEAGRLAGTRADVEAQRLPDGGRGARPLEAMAERGADWHRTFPCNASMCVHLTLSGLRARP